MSSPRVSVRRIVFYAVAAGGLFTACSGTTKPHRDPAGSGGSRAGSGGSAGDTVAGGGSGGGGQDGGLDAAAGGAPSFGGEDAATGGASSVGGANWATGGAPSVGGANGATGGQAGGVALGAAAPSYFHAGTRLKPQVFRGGGLEVLDNRTGSPWYDTETGDRCVFRKGADGIERCFPEFGHNDNTDFLDSSCTKPVLVTSNLGCEDNAPYHYLSVGPYSGSGCGSVTYRLGDPIPAGIPLYSNGADQCVRSGTSTSTVWPLEKVPPETFVAVQRVSRPTRPNMDAWVRQGADGSWEVIGFYDPVRKTPCSGLGADVSSDACVPDWVEPAYTFGDASCTRRVAIASPVVCGASEVSAVLEFGGTDDSCSVTKTIQGLWQVEAGRTAQLYDQDPFSNSCTRSGLGRVTTYPVGGAIDVASLPRLQVIRVGTGALRASFYGFDGVPFFPASGTAPFTEAASGDACTPYPFADGTWRCVPSTFPRVADYDLYYQSADCTGERVYPWSNNGCPNAPRQPVGMIVQLFGCGRSVSETLEFEETSSPGLVYHRTPVAACEDLGSFPRPGGKLFKATKVVNPADRFVPFERKLAD
jgi:hypothetical protein